MTIYNDICPLDTLYLKISDIPDIVSIPLCEAVIRVPGKLDADNCTEEQLKFVDDKGKTWGITTTELKKMLEADIFAGQKVKHSIIEFVIQPAGKLKTPEVSSFLDKYL